MRRTERGAFSVRDSRFLILSRWLRGAPADRHAEPSQCRGPHLRERQAHAEVAGSAALLVDVRRLRTFSSLPQSLTLLPGRVSKPPKQDKHMLRCLHLPSQRAPRPHTPSQAPAGGRSSDSAHSAGTGTRKAACSGRGPSWWPSPRARSSPTARWDFSGRKRSQTRRCTPVAAGNQDGPAAPDYNLRAEGRQSRYQGSADNRLHL